MDYDKRNSEDRSYPEGGKRRNLEENQRIGRDLNRNRGDQNWNEQYRSGQAYHNRNEGYSPEQTHYGARPDSAYRDESRINFGDNRHQNHNQRPYQNQRPENDPRQNQNSRNRQNYNNQNSDFDNPQRGDHSGTEFWGEREEYKKDDYRYTSGNRGNWQTPGTDDDNDDYKYRNQNRNYRQQNENPGFFDRMSERIDNAWDRMTGNYNDNNDRDRDYDRNNRHPQNRNFNRGYESGPRWADDNDDRYDQNQRDRNNRRDHRDNY